MYYKVSKTSSQIIKHHQTSAHQELDSKAVSLFSLFFQVLMLTLPELVAALHHGPNSRKSSDPCGTLSKNIPILTYLDIDFQIKDKKTSFEMR